MSSLRSVRRISAGRHGADCSLPDLRGTIRFAARRGTRSSININTGCKFHGSHAIAAAARRSTATCDTVAAKATAPASLASGTCRPPEIQARGTDATPANTADQAAPDAAGSAAANPAFAVSLCNTTGVSNIAVGRFTNFTIREIAGGPNASGSTDIVETKS